MKRNPLHQLLSYKVIYPAMGKLLAPLQLSALILMLYGLYAGLWLAPRDYLQGEAYRIIFIHVPCAFLSLMTYAIMGVSSIIYLIWRIKLADIVASCSASIGAAFTFCALITGALWGKPMWGTWWVWDARLTSELILFFLYLGYLALRQALENHPSCGRASAMLAAIGLIDLPIVHYSVMWWNTLHQGPSLARIAKPSIATPMLYPLLAMIGAFILIYLAILLLRVRTEILKREFNSNWLRATLQG